MIGEGGVCNDSASLNFIAYRLPFDRSKTPTAPMRFNA